MIGFLIDHYFYFFVREFTDAVAELVVSIESVFGYKFPVFFFSKLFDVLFVLIFVVQI